MSLRAPTEGPGALPVTRYGRAGTGRTERGGSDSSARGDGQPATRHPDGQVPTLPGAPVDTSVRRTGPRPAPVAHGGAKDDGRRPRDTRAAYRPPTRKTP